MNSPLSFKNRYMRRRSVVLAVLNGGHIDAVAREFGVSRASAYNWVRDYHESGATKLIHKDGDKRFALPGLTPYTTMRFVRSVVCVDPSRSADQLAEYLGSMGRYIPPRTVRNIFKELDISSADERLLQAMEWRDDVDPAQELSDEELDFMRALDALPAGELKGCRPGEVLVQDRVKVPKGICDGPLAMEIVVDTFSPLKRVYTTIGSSNHQLSIAALMDVRTKYKRDGIEILKVFTPRKAQYSKDVGVTDYPRILDNDFHIGHVVRPINSKEFDSRIRAVWDRMLRDWVAPMRKKFKSAQPITVVEDELEDWLQEVR